MGGIVGTNTISAQITNCYSEGDILGTNSGGIIGSNAGISSVEIRNCYSRGNITGANAGGICGSLGVISGVYTVTITNCYSTGNISNGGSNFNGGICGLVVIGPVNLTISHCYTTGTVSLSKGYIIANITTINGFSASPQYVLTNNYSEAGSLGGTPGSWSGAHANTVLQGLPTDTVGDTWVSSGGVNEPYELAAIGYTPYTVNIINASTPSLINTYNQTIQAGQKTITSLSSYASGNGFAILEKRNGNANSYRSITINSQTGSILTTAETSPESYTLIIRSIANYSISIFNLTVTENPAFTNTQIPNYANISSEWRYIIEQGQYMSTNASYTNVRQFGSYADYLKYRIANGF